MKRDFNALGCLGQHCNKGGVGYNFQFIHLPRHKPFKIQARLFLTMLKENAYRNIVGNGDMETSTLSPANSYRQNSDLVKG